MEQSGGRRLKRCLYLDMNSVNFCDADMLRKFRKIEIIKPYLDQKEKELEKFNAQKGSDESIINGRQQTNVGVFRAYISAYLKQREDIRKDMTFLIRQLQPSEKGLPLEIYVFSKDQAWANYEAIQADIFDHLLAAAPEFGLQIFQNPSGYDFRCLGKMESSP